MNNSESFHFTGSSPTQGISYFLVITLSPLRQVLTLRGSGYVFFFFLISFCKHDSMESLTLTHWQNQKNDFWAMTVFFVLRQGLTMSLWPT